MLTRKVNDEVVYSMKELAEKLSLPKYHIKNWIKDFELTPSYEINGAWIFNSTQLIPFITYLIQLEELRETKNELKTWGIKRN